MSDSVNTSPVAILGRMLDPERMELPSAAANALLKLGFDRQDRDRIHELAVKSQDGCLSADEQTELESYILVGHLLDVMHARARQSLSLVKSAAES